MCVCVRACVLLLLSLPLASKSYHCNELPPRQRSPLRHYNGVLLTHRINVWRPTWQSHVCNDHSYITVMMPFDSQNFTIWFMKSSSMLCKYHHIIIQNRNCTHTHTHTRAWHKRPTLSDLELLLVLQRPVLFRGNIVPRDTVLVCSLYLQVNSSGRRELRVSIRHKATLS